MNFAQSNQSDEIVAMLNRSSRMHAEVSVENRWMSYANRLELEP